MTARRAMAVLLAGVVVRALGFWSIGYRFDVGDAAGYDLLARNLVENGVFSLDTSSPYLPTAIRPPLYPLFLASTYEIFGLSPLPAQLIQLALTLLTPFVIYALMRKLWPRWAYVALWATMLCPFDVFYAGAHLSETLCATLLLVGLALPALRPQQLGAWIAGGVGFGLCILTRDVYLPALVVLIVVATFVPQARFNAKRWCPLTFAIASGLTVVPWTIRNRLVMHETIPVSKGLLGFNLWVGTWERDGAWVEERGKERSHFPEVAYRSDDDHARVRTLLALPLADQDRGFMALAIERMKSSPGATVLVWLERVQRPWLGTRSDLFYFWPELLQRGKPFWYLMKASYFALNFAIVGLGLAGMAIKLRSDLRSLWLALPVLMNGAVYLPVHSTETRYTQPVYLLVILFAVLAVGELLQWRQRRRSAASRVAQITSS
jgi:4-amino-4-deoxy-L-arabinose transferase-like glycosyltransferase